MLDEPTNHLDLETTRWLEEYLKSFSKTVLLISHDRAFLASVVDHVLHFEGGSASEYSGGYESFVQQREERRLTPMGIVDEDGDDECEPEHPNGTSVRREEWPHRQAWSMPCRSAAASVTAASTL